MIELSVITSFYNCEKYLRKYFESILSQNYQNFELILINDGSTDNSDKIVNEYKDKIEHLIYVSKKNTGISDSRNIGLNEANGKYLLFLDADDTFEPNMFSTLMNNVENNDLLIFGYNIFFESGIKEKDINYNINKLNQCQLIDFFLDKNLLIEGFCWNKIVKKSCISCQFHKEITIMEDSVFWIENAENIKSYKIINDKLYNYYIHPNSALNSIGTKKSDVSAMEADILLINKIPNNYIIFYKYNYCNAYYNILGRVKKKKNLEKYTERCIIFYKQVMNSKEISIKEKIKIFIKKNFNFMIKINAMLKY